MLYDTFILKSIYLYLHLQTETNIQKTQIVNDTHCR